MVENYHLGQKEIKMFKWNFPLILRKQALVALEISYSDGYRAGWEDGHNTGINFQKNCNGEIPESAPIYPQKEKAKVIRNRKRIK